MTSLPKSGLNEDQYLEEDMELFKLEGEGKKLGNNLFRWFFVVFLKEAPKWKGGWLCLCSGLFKIEA